MAGQALLSPKNRKTKRLTPAQQEAIVQTYFTVGTISGTARELGVTQATVRRIVDNSAQNPALAAARARAMDAMAGKISAVTHQVIDSITPDELETKFEPGYDRFGNVVRILQTGPSLKDKALSIGILTDKQRTLIDARTALTNPLQLDAGQTALMLPDSLDEARRLIAQKIRRLRIFDVEFDTGEIGQTLRRKAERGGISEKDIQEAELAEEPFDG